MDFWVQIFWSNHTVVDGCVVLCDVIGILFSSMPPEVAELLLGGAAVDPMEFHVNQFETFACYVIGNDSNGCSIVGWYIYHGLYYDHEMTDSDICGETVI